MGKTIVMRALEAKDVPYTVHKHARKQYTAERVAKDLGVPVAWVVKAMIVKRGSPPRSKRDFALVAVPGDRQLSLKKVAEALGEKHVAMASERDAVMYPYIEAVRDLVASGELRAAAEDITRR